MVLWGVSVRPSFHPHVNATPPALPITEPHLGAGRHHRMPAVTVMNATPMPSIVEASFSFTSTTFLLIILLGILPQTLSCTQEEKNSLLSFHFGLSNNSRASLPSWVNNTSCCRWDGIHCDDSGNAVALLLSSRGLRGRISSALGDLPYLARLDLSHNSLSGPLDAAILRSGSLVTVDLSFNSLSGPLPSPLTPASRLQVLNVSSNKFNGSFPPLNNAPELTVLNASNNSFSGPIPADICFVSRALGELDLSMNDFTDRIPHGFGKCSKLTVLRAGFNKLTGQIPPDLYDAVSLQYLHLPFNHISGTVAGVEKLGNLTVLDLSSNELGGELVDSIGKLGKLEHLVLNNNRLVGSLPSGLKNCTRLRCLNLRENSLIGELSTVNFSSFLDLDTLDLGNNNFTGSLPSTIYACRSLTALRLAKNSLEGEIAYELVNLRALSFLSLSANKLRNINAAFQIIKNCENLTSILLSRNFVNESIPNDVHVQGLEFANVRVLALANSQLKGEVPFWLSKLRKLEVLDLSINQLTGPLPGWLGELPHLFYLDLSQNKFDPGAIPMELLKLRVLASRQAAAEVNRSTLPLPVFYSNENTSSTLQYNQLSNLPAALYLGESSLEGDIPPEIGQLQMLQVLDLSKNNLSGQIPKQISNLTNLLRLVLSENHLSGRIPPELAKLNFLSVFNVSYNNLYGPIPKGGQFDSFPCSSFAGNPGLNGSIIDACRNKTERDRAGGNKAINKNLVVGIVLGICFGALGLILLVLVMLSKKREELPVSDKPDKEDIGVVFTNSIPEIPRDEMENLVVLFPGNSDMKSLTVSDILKATNNFNQDYIVGCGGFGLVYKAILPDGSKWAIKRLSGETGIMEREFKAEVEALSNAKHENLVTLQGYCIYRSFRLLIYSYMENGSLDYWLHEKIGGAETLTWQIRLQIARGVGRGLSYIHQICEPHIVHRDIKSSNILLDHEFQAHVADFGLSRLILPTNTHVSTELVGTLGYIPPEYGQAWIATLRGDIYSFGVVVLELLTGRRPFEVCKPRQSRELVVWVQQVRSQGHPEEIFDPVLKHGGFMEQMLQVLDLACLCVSSNPFKRPTIKEIVDCLDSVTGNQQK